MYKAFDEFLAAPTWWRPGGTDDERFYTALDTVVRSRDFYPTDLRAYIDQKRKNGEESQASLNQDKYDEMREFWVASALAVKNYLRWTHR